MLCRAVMESVRDLQYVDKKSKEPQTTQTKRIPRIPTYICCLWILLRNIGPSSTQPQVHAAAEQRDHHTCGGANMAVVRETQTPTQH